MFSIRKISTKTDVKCIMLRHCFEKHIKVQNKSIKVLLTYKNHHENRFTRERETTEQLFEIRVMYFLNISSQLLENTNIFHNVWII